MLRFSIIFLVSCFLFLSCKSKQAAIGSGFKERSEADLVRAVTKHNVSFDWFSCKAKINFESSYESGRVNATVRIKKDSLIWMNFKKFGLSVARMQIKPDSIYVLYPFENYYERKTVKKYSEIYGIDLEFEKIQSFFVGNALEPDPETVRVKRIGNDYELFGAAGDYTVRYLIDAVSLVMREHSIIDTYGREVKILFDEYMPVEGGRYYSHQRKYLAPIDANEIGSAEIAISDVEFNVPKSTPFNIPSHYETFDN
jgi:hypothetical protein